MTWTLDSDSTQCVSYDIYNTPRCRLLPSDEYLLFSRFGKKNVVFGSIDGTGGDALSGRFIFIKIEVSSRSCF